MCYLFLAGDISAREWVAHLLFDVAEEPFSVPPIYGIQGSELANDWEDDAF